MSVTNVLEFVRKWDRAIVLILSFIAASVIFYSTVKDSAKKVAIHEVKLEQVDRFMEVQKEINSSLKDGLKDMQKDIKEILRNSR